ncbi:DUF2815 family protein [Clostridium sp. DL1XJH146]
MANDLIKVVTSKVRFDYANVWRPRSFEDGPLKYSIRIIVKKDDNDDTMAKINKAIMAAKKVGVVKYGREFLEDINTLVHDGDELEEEEYKNTVYFNASSTIKPEIVGPSLKHINNESEFYSGCYGRASLFFFSYDKGGNHGIGCCLNNLQKLEDGEHLYSRSSAEEDFSVVDSHDQEEDFLS